MKRILFYLLAAFFWLCHNALSADITLLERAEVSGQLIRLGDVADFQVEPELAKALATVPIGQAPGPGESITIRSMHIKRNLIHARKVPRELSWTGSPAVTIYRKGIQVSADRIQEIINEYLSANSHLVPEAKMSFTPQSLPLPFVLPLGKLEYEVVPSHPGILGSSRFSIIFKVDDRVVKNMSVIGSLDAIGKAIVANASLKKGTLLRPQDLTTAVIDISKAVGATTDAAELVGKRLKKNVRSGSPISQKMVETLPVVFRGQKVKIVLSTGSLFLTATGLAHSDGRLEEMIRVQNLSSNKILYCRVAAPGLVEVML